MNCKHLIEHLDEYAADNLRGWARWRLRLHLWVCRNCRRYLATYIATVRLAKQAMGDTPADSPDELTQAILSAIRRS
jgi:hypothetical protein